MAGIAATAARAASDELAELTLSVASAMIAKKVVSPVDLTEVCLKRIERLNPRLNAFITVTGEQAMDQARALEAELQAGRRRGPLHGIPVALKDLIDTAGVKTTGGSALYAERLPLSDAEVVRRLGAAGAICVGKLNLHEFAFGATSVISHFGPVHNPWKLEHHAGGSSGGSGAAVAAGLCYGALGTDTGGSIRIPAARCGIVGLKPTYGRVSTRGVIPLSWSLDTVGPMCRTVADTALLLQAIAGYDAAASGSLDDPVPDYSAAIGTRVSTFKLGIPRAVFYEQLHPEVEAAVNAALEVLSKLTASTREVRLPPIPDLPLEPAEAWTFHQGYLAKSPQLYHATTKARIEAGSKITEATHLKARENLVKVRQAVRAVFSAVDLLVLPTVPDLPETIEEAIKKEALPGPPLAIRNTRIMNVYGLPSISIPCGFSRSGLPIGLQIAGPALGEVKVMALAHAYEQATEWHKRKPPLPAG
ncbi:MAG: amidase [Acidobacteria bacterium]|nr:amidase [Acidobacteriota bacterium]MBI3469762.1 amidase [Candidatus Solibacter usitatus]